MVTDKSIAKAFGLELKDTICSNCDNYKYPICEIWEEEREPDYLCKQFWPRKSEKTYGDGYNDGYNSGYIKGFQEGYEEGRDKYLNLP